MNNWWAWSTTARLALPITCLHQAGCVRAGVVTCLHSLLAGLLPLADYSKFSLVSSPLAAATRRVLHHVRRLLLVFINYEYSYFSSDDWIIEVRITEYLLYEKIHNTPKSIIMISGAHERKERWTQHALCIPTFYIAQVASPYLTIIWNVVSIRIMDR